MIDRHKEIGKVGKRGLVAGTFDLLHFGYFKLFEDAKNHCDFLLAAIHCDPSYERPNSHKKSPLHYTDERAYMLESIRYIDETVIYHTEKDLRNILKSKKIDLIILGSDYKGKPYTGQGSGIDVYYHNRQNHNWSTTELRKRIKEQ